MLKVEEVYPKFPKEHTDDIAKADIVLPKGATVRAIYYHFTYGVRMVYDYRPEPGNATEARQFVMVQPGGMFQDGGKDERAKFVCAVIGKTPVLVYEIVAY